MAKKRKITWYQSWLDRLKSDPYTVRDHFGFEGNQCRFFLGFRSRLWWFQNCCKKCFTRYGCAFMSFQKSSSTNRRQRSVFIAGSMIRGGWVRRWSRVECGRRVLRVGGSNRRWQRRFSVWLRSRSWVCRRCTRGSWFWGRGGGGRSVWKTWLCMGNRFCARSFKFSWRGTLFGPGQTGFWRWGCPGVWSGCLQWDTRSRWVRIGWVSWARVGGWYRCFRKWSWWRWVLRTWRGFVEKICHAFIFFRWLLWVKEWFC